MVNTLTTRVCLLLAVCTVFVGANSAVFRAKRAETSCTLSNGTEVANGNIFAFSGSPCIKYTCSNGGYSPTTIECNDYSGGCMAMGATKTFGCSIYECQKREKVVGLQITVPKCSINTHCIDVDAAYSCVTCKYNSVSKTTYTENKCSDYQGGCIAVGATTTYYCSTYQCKASATSVGLEITEHKCSINKQCFAPDETSGCITCKYNSSSKSVYTENKCSDGNGGCVALGQTTTVGCSTYQCQQNGNSIGLKVTVPVCKIGSKCVNPEDTYGCITCKYNSASNSLYTENKCSDNQGGCIDVGATTTYYCSTYKCKESATSVGLEMTVPKCKIGSICVDQDDTHSCITCRYNSTSKTTYTENKCSDYQGGCIAVGATTMYGCSTYECKESTTSIGLEIKEPKCRIGSLCVAADDTHSCITCKYNSTSKTTYTERKCSDYKGGCIAVGATTTYYCSTYECKESGNTIGLDIKEPKCQIGTHCVAENATKSCITCKYNRTSMTVYTENKCSDNQGGCIAVGATTTYYCSKYECKESTSSIGLQIVEPKCQIGSQCVAEDATHNCITCKYNSTSMSTFTENKCNDYQGSCIAVGATTTYYCSTYECTESGNSIGLEMKVPKCQIGSQCVSPDDTYSCITCKYNSTSKTTYTENKCSDYQGGCIALGAETTYYCSKYVCKQSGNSFGLAITVPKCKIGSQCVAPDDTYSCITCRYNSTSKTTYTENKCNDNNRGCIAIGATTTSYCSTYECKQNGNSIALEMTIPKCKIGSQCVAQDATYNCITCKYNSISKTTYTENKCSDYQGGCIAIGATTTYYCSTYECKQSGNTIGLEITEPKCKIGSQCIAQDATYSCVTCKYNSTSKNTYTENKCSNYQGGCIAIGATTTYYCSTYECKLDGTSLGLAMTVPRCSINSQCVEKDQTHNCMTCGFNSTSSQVYTDYKCSYNNSCYPAGTFTSGSSTCTCTVTITGTSVSRKVQCQ